MVFPGTKSVGNLIFFDLEREKGKGRGDKINFRSKKPVSPIEEMLCNMV